MEYRWCLDTAVVELMWLPLIFAEKREGTKITQGRLGGCVNRIIQHVAGEMAQRVKVLEAKLTGLS